MELIEALLTFVRDAPRTIIIAWVAVFAAGVVIAIINELRRSR